MKKNTHFTKNYTYKDYNCSIIIELEVERRERIGSKICHVIRVMDQAHKYERCYFIDDKDLKIKKDRILDEAYADFKSWADSMDKTVEVLQDLGFVNTDSIC